MLPNLMFKLGMLEIFGGFEPKPKCLLLSIPVDNTNLVLDNTGEFKNNAQKVID